MDENHAAQKRAHRMNLLFPVILILGVTLFSLLRGGGGSTVVTEIDSENGVLGIANVTESTFLYLADINSVEYVHTLDIGTPETKEEGTVHYTNDAYGSYLLFPYGDNPDFVVIHTDEQVVAVNAKNETQTEKFYEELTVALDG